jgi:TPR repeat protein
MKVLGDLHFNGLGTKKDYEAAHAWYEKSAGLGNPNAMLSLAAMCATGSGVKKDPEKALLWIRRAAAKGHAKAIAILKDRGESVPIEKKPR